MRKLQKNKNGQYFLRDWSLTAIAFTSACSMAVVCRIASLVFLRYGFLHNCSHAMIASLASTIVLSAVLVFNAQRADTQPPFPLIGLDADIASLKGRLNSKGYKLVRSSFTTGTLFWFSNRNHLISRHAPHWFKLAVGGTFTLVSLRMLVYFLLVYYRSKMVGNIKECIWTEELTAITDQKPTIREKKK